MKVVIDNNLPWSLARILRQRSLDAVHVVDLGLANASDQKLREYFATQEVILLSRDDDFWRNAPSKWTVVWIALHNPTLTQLKGPVTGVLMQVIPKLRPGQRVLFAADQVRIFTPS